LMQFAQTKNKNPELLARQCLGFHGSKERDCNLWVLAKRTNLKPSLEASVCKEGSKRGRTAME